MTQQGATAVEVHGYVHCPFAWRVLLAAAEKGVPVDWIPCDVDDPDPRAREHNPDEHSPLLWHAGLSLQESAIIASYLDEGFPGRALLPPEARARAELRLASVKLETLNAHKEPSKPEARRKSEGALKTLERLTADGGFVHGAEPGLADVLCWPFLANLAVRRLIDARTLPNVTNYLERAAKRDSFQSTKPPWAASL